MLSNIRIMYKFLLVAVVLIVGVLSMSFVMAKEEYKLLAAEKSLKTRHLTEVAYNLITQGCKKRGRSAFHGAGPREKTDLASAL